VYNYWKLLRTVLFLGLCVTIIQCEITEKAAMSANKSKSPNFRDFIKNKKSITPNKTISNLSSDLESTNEEEQQFSVKKRKIEEEEEELEQDDEQDDQDILTAETDDGLNIFGEVIGAENEDSILEELQEENAQDLDTAEVLHVKEIINIRRVLQNENLF
jgi:hypothetical protein